MGYKWYISKPCTCSRKHRNRRVPAENERFARMRVYHKVTWTIGSILRVGMAYVALSPTFFRAPFWRRRHIWCGCRGCRWFPVWSWQTLPKAADNIETSRSPSDKHRTRNAVIARIDFLLRDVVRASRSKKSDPSNNTSDDESDFLVRGFDGRLLADRQKLRPRKSERMSMHIPADFLGRGF